MRPLRIFVLASALVVALGVMVVRTDGPSGAFDARLRAEVPEAFEAFDARLSDFERTTAIRDWAYRNIDAAGTTKAGTGAYDNRNFEERSAADIFAGFDADEGGVFCGNAAVSLRMLYDELGWEAWTLDMGLPGLLTHVTTLVRLPDTGQVIVQDPYFGATFMRDGEPVDVRDALSDLGSVEWTEANLGPREILFLEGEERVLWQYDEPPACRRTEQGWSCDAPMDLSAMERHTKAQATRAALTQRGVDDSLLSLFLFPLTVGGPDAAGLLAEVQAAVSS